MRTMKRITQRLRLPLTLALVATPGILCPVPASADDTLDQSQPVSQSPATVSASVPKAQIFTAGMYGQLDQVSLCLENYSASPPAGAVLTVSIQTVIGGLPSGKQIGSGTIPLIAIPPPGFRDWVDIGIRGALVTAGTQYALVLQTSNILGSVNWWYAYQGYAGGAMALDDGTAWRIDGMFDFTFQTYVIRDALDQWQTGIGSYRTASTFAQIFTAGVSGILDRAIVFTNNTEPLDVTIQTVTGGYPSGIVIGQGPIPTGSLSYWHTASISGAPVTAGAQYALVLHSNSAFQLYPVTTYPDGSPAYPGGELMIKNSTGWSGGLKLYASFQTFVVPPVAFSPPPPPPLTNTPCSSGVCPAVVGSVTPPDSTARVTSLVQFQELPDGTVRGILIFDDSQTGNFVLRGCTTDSAACRLTVTTLACTDQHAITVAGTYTPKGQTGGYYRLTLSGARGGIGAFTLTADNYTYTLTHNGIVDVTCPPR